MSALIILGFLILIHSGYSSYEYNAFIKTKGTSVPYDIVLEVIIGLVLINFGVLGSLKTRYRFGITHNEPVWPPLNFLMPIDLNEANAIINQLGVTEFEELDTRRDFIDVKKKRKEYAEWVAKQES